ncbi:polysaccharide biosynthesis tyrosine autokinase [Mucilaginibacter sabulilitoris]|uniref:non-specific protein-tyrosine kinase n=1 Tax=Mucilaginibacter sabulilitoris TaxID=1173583 RepID=A0ABZ0TRC6_9SPHI|nr:polysaccharide biosynthesis tyrosine autokinase [Mucilaginibacter sabulilitoris]WPU95681.1 polysaccharide biosynthesis tyrosine autokinase [Mucilaginibacter sabulilitoris]
MPINKTQQALTSRQARGDDDSIDFKHIFRQYFGHWPLYLICLTIALAAAFAFFKIKKPVFDVKATMLMQDDSKEKPNEDKSALQELDLVNPPKIVENEIEVFKSRSLIKSVVDHLQLWVNYQSVDGLIKNDLYGMSPITFNLYKSEGTIPSQVLIVKILNSDAYCITDENKKVTNHRFRDTIADRMGSWNISPTAHLTQYIGKTVNVILGDREATILSYQNGVEVSMPDKLASVIELSTTDLNAKRGEDFLNNLIFYYKQAELIEKNNLTKSTIDFIDKRLDSLVGELNSAEGKVEGYRSSKGLTDLNAQSQVYLQSVQSNEAKSNEVSIQLSILNGLERYVNSNTDIGTPSVIGISDPTLVGLIQKLSDLQLEKTKLLATLPEQNPAFDPLNKQITSTKQHVKESLQNIKSSLLATKRELQSFKTTSQSSISNIPGQERQLVGLKRQQSIKENLYTYLLQKREQISLSYASSLSSARLLDVAYSLPQKKSKRYIPFAAALLLGLIIPTGFVYVKGLAKDTVNKRKEIEVATSLPILAEISFTKLNHVIVTEKENQQISFALIEQFRHLRTQLNILRSSEKSGQIVLISSSITKEGKSFVSSNLAVSLARSGKKTILLEMDIYKPKISSAFGLGKGVGLTDYLMGSIKRDQLIQEIPAHPNLRLISSGTYVDSFAELLDQSRFSHLIDELKMEYDYIFLDTPPLHSINDANILAQYSDTTLFVVRHGYTPKSMLAFIRKLDVNHNLPNMQIIFNGLKDGRDGTGYKYESYYSHKDMA